MTDRSSLFVIIKLWAYFA